MTESKKPLSRRDFVKGGLHTMAAAGALGMIAPRAYADEGKTSFGLGIVGCGGRGTGAVSNCLSAATELGIDVKLVAMADLAGDRLQGSRKSLKNAWEAKGRYAVTDESCFVGIDAYKHLCAHPDVDIVIHTTPPGLRWLTLREAVNSGKHSFVEKPVCVDAFSYRNVLESGALASTTFASRSASTKSRIQRACPACQSSRSLLPEVSAGNNASMTVTRTTTAGQ